MRYLILLFGFLFLSFEAPDDIYIYSIGSVDGTTISLQQFKGKKLLVFLLPDTQLSEDSAWLSRIDSICRQNEDSLAIIGVPSIEDGYVGNLQNTVSTWYRSVLDSNIMITKPCLTHKSSGSDQEGLFQWISSADKNGYFEKEITGTGSMFFISGTGELSGFFGPEAKWSNKVINRMLP